MELNSWLDAGGTERPWKRVSSVKPQVLPTLGTAMACVRLMLLLREQETALPLASTATLVTPGLMRLIRKAKHKCGNEDRISTLFHSEVVIVDGVCMSVIGPGAFWHRFRKLHYLLDSFIHPNC